MTERTGLFLLVSLFFRGLQDPRFGSDELLRRDAEFEEFGNDSGETGRENRVSKTNSLV